MEQSAPVHPGKQLHAPLPDTPAVSDIVTGRKWGSGEHRENLEKGGHTHHRRRNRGLSTGWIRRQDIRRMMSHIFRGSSLSSPHRATLRCPFAEGDGASGITSRLSERG